MRIIFMIWLIACASGCMPPAGNSRILYELEDYYQQMADDHVRELEGVYVWGHEAFLKKQYHTYGFSNDKKLQAMVAKIDSMHTLVKGFLAFADSVSLKFRGRRDYPLTELLMRYSSTNDLLTTLHPIDTSKMKVENYLKSSLTPSVAIIASRMKSDVAQNAYQVMYNHIDVTVGHTIYDEFWTPAIKPLIQSPTTYSFTIHQGWAQELPYRELHLDSVLSKGKLTKYKPSIHSEDILAVVTLDSLHHGKYVVKGRVKAIAGKKIDIRPFVHHFEIND